MPGFAFRPFRTLRGRPALLLPALGALLTAAAQAQTALPDATQQQILIQREQQERLRQEQERALQRPAAPPGTDLRQVKPQVSAPDISGCHPIHELRIEGAAHLGEAARAAAARKVTAHCVDASSLEAVLGDLTKDYVVRGFVTTRIYLPPQDLGTGVLRLQVVEGRIERYQLEQLGGRDGSVWLRGAFPAPGQVLNLRDLEQGLEQINALRSNHATLDLQPGTEPGQTVVVVRNRAGKPVHLYLSYDNLGNPATGRDSVAATLSLDSVLGLNELIALTRSQTLLPEAGHQANSTGLRMAVPYGYWNFAADASHSEYSNMLALASGLPLLASGQSDSYGLTTGRVVFRDRDSRVSVSGRLGLDDADNDLGGQRLSVSSRKLSTLDLGVSGFQPLAGGVANGRLGYVRGLGILGALHDAPGLPADYPRAQFGKFTLSLGYQHAFQVARRPLQWTSLLNAQYAQQPLFGSQQFLLGSASTVRGTRINSISADHGALMRNDVAWPWSARVGGDLVGGTFYVGHDIGRVRNRYGSVAGSMSSATLGGTAQWRGFNLEVFASRALHLPGAMTGEGTLVGVRLSLSL